MSEPHSFDDRLERDRRRFLQWSLAAGLGLYEVVPVKAAEHASRSPMESKGIYHLIAPERVIVMTASGGDGWPGRESRLEASLRASLDEQFHLPAGKLDIIVRLMRVMTDYYRVPHLFPSWTTGLATREALGSTGVGSGFGLLHQFQNDGAVRLKSPPADWWLILSPEGIDWDSWEPVFGMIGHIFPSHHQQLPGMTLRAYALATEVGRIIGQNRDNWSRLAKLPRSAAAQRVNEIIMARGREELQRMGELARQG